MSAPRKYDQESGVRPEPARPDRRSPIERAIFGEHQARALFGLTNVLVLFGNPRAVSKNCSATAVISGDADAYGSSRPNR